MWYVCMLMFDHHHTRITEGEVRGLWQYKVTLASVVSCISIVQFSFLHFIRLQVAVSVTVMLQVR